MSDFDINAHFAEREKRFKENWAQLDEKIANGEAGVLEIGASWFIRTGFDPSFDEMYGTRGDVRPKPSV